MKHHVWIKKKEAGIIIEDSLIMPSPKRLSEEGIAGHGGRGNNIRQP
jgi:hypothetical protein